MSHRHQAQRRRTYGRRQHDLHQRRLARSVDPKTLGVGIDTVDPGPEEALAPVSGLESEPLAARGSFPGFFVSGLRWAQGRG